MLDSGSCSGTYHSQHLNAMLMRSLDLLMLVHLTYCHRFAMVRLAMDGTFDGWLELRALHRIVVVSYCCSAFDRGPLEPLLPLNKPAKLNDVKRIRANHQNALEKRRTLQKERENDYTKKISFL